MAHRILIAEDEPELADVLVGLFEDEGFDVRHARDGAEALAQVDRDPPDLVISNVEMPRVDGIELARRLGERSRRIPVVLMSAGGRRVDLPGVAFVAKPFEVEVILGLVHRLLPPTDR